MKQSGTLKNRQQMERFRVAGHLDVLADLVGNDRNITRLVSRKIILFRHDSGEYQEVKFGKRNHSFVGIRQPKIENFISRFPEEAVQITIIQ